MKPKKRRRKKTFHTMSEENTGDVITCHMQEEEEDEAMKAKDKHDQRQSPR